MISCGLTEQITLRRRKRAYTTVNSYRLFALFKFAISFALTIFRGSRTEIAVYIRLDGVDLFALFLETCSFIVEPLLFFGELILLSLERLQARKFPVSPNGKECTLSRLKDDQLGFVFCSECGLVLCLLEGFIDRLEPLIIADVFDEGLHPTQSCFNSFQFLSGALIRQESEN